jgi:hypothetical protein
VNHAEEWLDPLVGPYELRVTRQCREDLGASKCKAATNLDEIAATSQYSDIVEKFSSQRLLDPSGTEAPLSRVHRNDIFKLDGRNGARAITWYDREHGVVWLLGFTPNHDMREFEARASRVNSKGMGGASQLMPSRDDYQDLNDERGVDWKLKQVIDALSAAVEIAKNRLGTIVLANLDNIVKVEVLVAERGNLRELYLRFLVPPIEKGVLPSSFQWILTGALAAIDDATIGSGGFPGPVLPGSLDMHADLL